jgi:predicted component of type VI protein secretion system
MPSSRRDVWLRDLKRADWASVERLCVATLATRSKDLQVACWLTESWGHLQGFAGLTRGLASLGELGERFWPDLYPAIEEGDLSARVAPLERLNEKLLDLAAPHLLKFTIPVSLPITPGSEAVGPEDQVTAYIRISVTAPGATVPQTAAIVLPDFPELAPELSGSRSVPHHREHPPRVSGMVEPL